MTITVAVTGGIGAGKSTVSGLLAARGAVVVDSDRLAREVVDVGTPGLAAVADQFGGSVIAGDGSLDRAALAAIVFGDPTARRRLEAITHPLVRARFRELQAVVPQRSVVVNDIPLLTTAAAAAAFHLVIGVGAPEEIRVRRLVGRGLTEADARARIAAQIDDTERRMLCDVWIDNGSTPAVARSRTDALWSRLQEFAADVDEGRSPPRGGPELVPYRSDWPDIARRLAARVRHAVGEARVDHIGSTAVPGLPAKDVIDLQLTVADLEQADHFAPLLAAAGFPRLDAYTRDTPHDGRSSDGPHDAHDSGRWSKRLHANADPGQRVNLHLRVKGWPNWVWALRFRDWLIADETARAEYLAVKQRAARDHGSDGTIEGYVEAKEEFLAASDVRAATWARQTGWDAG